MKRVPTPRSLVFASLFAASAMAGPAFAQAVATPETPPVTATQPAPAPAAAPAAPVATANPVFAPNSEIVQPIPPRPAPVAEAPTDVPAAAPVQRRAATRVAAAPSAAAPVRTATRAAVPAPAATADVETLTPPAEAETPAEIAPAPIPAPVTEAPVAAPAAIDFNWIWLALAILASGVAAVMLLGRRRTAPAAYAATDEDDFVAAPAAVTEVDLDARPFIRLTVEPVAQRDRDGEQLVDYIVLVENEGHLPARDVRISQFVTSDGTGVPAAPETRRVDVGAGASVPLEGEIALHGASAAHIVVDARYPLPDGREGRLAARFGIDLTRAEMTAEVEDVMERV